MNMINWFVDLLYTYVYWKIYIEYSILFLYKIQIQWTQTTLQQSDGYILKIESVKTTSI